MNEDVESSRRPRVITGEMSPQTKFALVVIGIGIFLMVVLLPLSYIGVEYYELGLRKQKSTGKVKLDKVYASGRYMIGPDYTFKTFQADAHYEELSKIVTFSSDKVEVEITCAMQYFLRPEDLKDMHQEYDVYYKPVVRTTANAAIKSRATELAVSQFIRDRLTVERELFKALKERLEGRCCRIDCAETNTCTGCIEHSKCKTSDKGLFVEVRYFQFLDFDIHSDVKSRYLRQVTEREQEEQAQYELKEKVVRKETERRKNEFINAAAEIEQEAKTNATIIRAKANAEALLIVERARDKGLSLLYQQLNITKEEHKAAFNYLRTLRGQKNVKLNVGYNTLMARN